MSSFWKKLSIIDNKTKYAIYGWMRKTEEELSLCHIPIIISSISIIYFYEYDVFETVGKDTKISSDGKSITKLENSRWRNNYGKITIASNTNNIYRWDFKLKKLKHFYVIIGITNSKKLYPNRNFLYTYPTFDTYALDGVGYTIVSNMNSWDFQTTRKLKQSDEISMILNLKTAKLKFLLDNNDEWNQCLTIEKEDDLPYRMFVSLLCSNDCIELTKFTVTLQ